MDNFHEYLKKMIKESFIKSLEEEPWWCLMCGEGGNYMGERPDIYMFPPESHACRMKTPEFRGIICDD